jgi:hypothetical protein
LNLFEVSTLGQPFEVVKTQLAANRGQSLAQALSTVYSRGGVFGFYQGLIPWAWIEGATKGAVLLFTASEFEYRALVAGASPFMVRKERKEGYNGYNLHKNTNKQTRVLTNCTFSILKRYKCILCICTYVICFLRLVSLVAWLVVLLKPTQQWVSAPL